MSDILLAIVLLAVSILPSASLKEPLETNLKNKVSAKSEVSRNIAPADFSKIPDRASFEDISLGARSALFVDRASGEILYEKDKDKKVPMASTTKLMTALIAVEYLDPNKVIVVPSLNTQPLDSVVGLTPGEKIKASELLHGLLIESGADAAITIANEVSGNQNNFAKLMNERAKLMGLENTNFKNSVGNDEDGHYSTATDLIKLTRYALTNDAIREITRKKSYALRTESGKTYFLVNTNKLLGSSYFGVKTGTTFAAGECLVSLYKEGDREIIGAVLGSTDRFYETQKIIEWTKSAFSW